MVEAPAWRRVFTCDSPGNPALPTAARVTCLSPLLTGVSTALTTLEDDELPPLEVLAAAAPALTRWQQQLSAAVAEPRQCRHGPSHTHEGCCESDCSQKIASSLVDH